MDKRVSLSPFLGRGLGTGLFLLLSGSCLAQTWSLTECINYAVEHNINVQQQDLAAKQAEIELNTAKFRRLPNLNGGVSQNFSYGRVTSPETNGYTNKNNSSSNFNINTSVPLFTGLDIPNSYKLAKLNVNAALEDLNKAKEDIGITVASSFLQTLFNRELSEVAKAQVVLSKEQLTRTERLCEVGKTSTSELFQAKARVAQDELAAVQAENNYQLAVLDLAQLMELPSPEGFSIQSPEKEPDFYALTPPAEIYAQALTFKPEILAANHRLSGAKHSIRIAQSAYYPQLSFGAGMGTGYYYLSGAKQPGFSQQWKDNMNQNISFSLSVPLFNRFSTRNRVRSARLQQQDLALRLDNTRKVLYKEIQQAYYNALAAETKFRAGTVAMEANEEAFKLTAEKYNQGKATTVEYNEANLNLLRSVSERIQAKFDYVFRSMILNFYKGEPLSL